MALSNAERNRRYRARLRGEKVPLGKPGRKPKSEYFRTEFPEEWLAPLLNLDPQRLRDLESSVHSRGLTLAEYVEAAASCRTGSNRTRTNRSCRRQMTPSPRRS